MHFDGMDLDTVSELMPEGRDRYRLNVRAFSANKGNVGAIETVNGNTLVSFTLPAGGNFVIGAKEYTTKKKLYYFIYNNLGNHSILEFDSVLNAINYVISGSFLNFSMQFRITGINVIELDQDNHLLYWTDNNEEPKKINIEKGKYFMLGDFVNGYVSPFNPENIFRIKQPHLLSPTAVYGDDPGILVNRLTEKLFQFKVQYVYDDKEPSSWGPISATPYPLSSDTEGKNNKISITVKTGIDIVRRIRIAAKVSTSSTFFLIADLDKVDLNIASNSNYVYDFYNDGNYSNLEVNESIKLFDNVPKKSKSQEIIKGNRIVDGDITEGFDPVPADLELNYTLNQSGSTGFYVDGIRINHNGLYNFTFNRIPVVTIVGDGTGATAEVTGMVVGNFKINDKGFGHVGSTQLTFSSAGEDSPAAAHVDFDIYGRADSVILDSGGLGYKWGPFVSVKGNSVSEAYIVALMAITQITVTNPGSGYTYANVVITNYNEEVEPIETSVRLSGEKINPVASYKRGGAWTEGIVYYDHGNRSSVANVNQGDFDKIQANGRYGSRLFIPFYTEPNPLGAAQLSFDMKVDGVNVIDSGSGYTGATTLTFSGGTPSVTATATPIIGAGKITELIQSNIGAGYTPDGDYTVNLSGGSGSGATAKIVITGGAVESFYIINAGTGYIETDVLSVSTVGASPALGGPTTVATFTLKTDYQKIIGANITNPGSGYDSAATITVFDSGGGSGAIVNPTYKVDTVTVVFGSSDYVSPPAAYFVGGNPQMAATLITGLSSGVVTSTTLTNAGIGYNSFPELKVEGRVYGGSYPTVNWAIYNEPPSWATHYQIVRTQNILSSRYLQFAIDSIEYLDRSGNVRAYGDSEINQMRISLANLPFFQTENPGTIIKYDFVKGDRVRFKCGVNQKVYDSYYDWEIGYYTTADQRIGVKFPPGTYPNVPNFEAGAIIEIYSPKLNVEETETIIYEIACGNDVLFDAGSGKYYHKGDAGDQAYWSFTSSSNSGGFVRLSSALPHGLSAGNKIRIQQAAGFTNADYNTYAVVTTVVDTTTFDTNLVFGSPVPTQTGVVTKPALGVFDGGDTFYKNRAMVYDTHTQGKTVLIEDANYSDLYSSQSYDYGRPNVIDPYAREVNRMSTVYYGEQFIPETNINGMSTVYPDSFRTYEVKYGSIQKMYAEDQKLNIFQELKIGAIPIEQNIFSGTQGGTVVGTSTEVLSSTVQYYIGEFGIGRNPSSFAVNGTAKYGLDINRGVAWRLSIDGLTPISDIYFMKTYFNKKCQDLLTLTNNFAVVGVYDISKNEYVVSLYVIDGLNIQGETLAFNERHNRWSSFYSFIPDCFCQNGVGVVSFRLGSLYTHDTNSVQGEFYGVQFPSKVEFYLNADPSDVKVLEAIGEESTFIWELDFVTNVEGQQSNLIEADFVKKEGVYYAPTWRDELTPNVVNPLFEGDEMRSRVFYLQFRYGGTAYNKTFAFNMNYITSNLHNRQ